VLFRHDRSRERGIPGDFLPGMQLAGAPTRLEADVQRSHTVLIAEDDDDLRATMAQLVEAEGHTVVECKTGHAVVSHVAETLLRPMNAQPVSLIITDVYLPGVSGLEAVARLRRCTVKTPVIVVTGNDSVRVRHHADAVGAAAFLVKPFGPTELRQLLSTLLAGQRPPTPASPYRPGSIA
jgi:DNA-binding response OmpR family regulator